MGLGFRVMQGLHQPCIYTRPLDSCRPSGFSFERLVITLGSQRVICQLRALLASHIVHVIQDVSWLQMNAGLGIAAWRDSCWSSMALGFRGSGLERLASWKSGRGMADGRRDAKGYFQD